MSRRTHKLLITGGKTLVLADTYNIVKEDSAATVTKSTTPPSVMAKRIQPNGGASTDWWLFFRWAASLAGWKRIILGGYLSIENGSADAVLINSGGPLDIAEAYVMTEDWDPDTLCWNNKPALPAGAIDWRVTTWVNASATETDMDGNAGGMAMVIPRSGSIVSPDSAVGVALKVTSFSEFFAVGKTASTVAYIRGEESAFAVF